jgi:hypothetical protein
MNHYNGLIMLAGDDLPLAGRYRSSFFDPRSFGVFTPFRQGREAPAKLGKPIDGTG